MRKKDKEGAEFFTRTIAMVRVDPGPPPGWAVTLQECEHTVWYAAWPMWPRLPCGACVNEYLKNRKRKAVQEAKI